MIFSLDFIKNKEIIFIIYIIAIVLMIIITLYLVYKELHENK